MTMQIAELIRVSKGSVAISGEPLAYPNSPDPEMTASIMPNSSRRENGMDDASSSRIRLHSGRRAHSRVRRGRVMPKIQGWRGIHSGP